MAAAKRVLRYIKGTLRLGIKYSVHEQQGVTGQIGAAGWSAIVEDPEAEDRLIGWSDSDWGGLRLPAGWRSHRMGEQASTHRGAVVGRG